MNKDKVYLKGYVIGHAADTLGYQGLMVQLENLDVVEIDKNLVHKDINEPKPVKLKDVIARIKDFDSGTQKVWLNEILNELGSDYGTLKYKAGYEQGKFESGLAGIERAWNKPVVPQFVADWYEANKDDFDYNLWEYLTDWEEQEPSDFKNWINDEFNTFQTLVNMHQFGYEVEKEKRYLVKIKNIHSYSSMLKRDDITREYFFGNELQMCASSSTHTRKELEEAGFGWVFDCPGIEIEEVEE